MAVAVFLRACSVGVGHGVTDHVLEEHLEYAAGLLVDEATDALDATTAREAADSGLGDALDVVAQHLAMALGAALAESLASFTASRHVCQVSFLKCEQLPKSKQLVTLGKAKNR